MHPQIALQAHRLLLQRPGPVCNRLPPLATGRGTHRPWPGPVRVAWVVGEVRRTEPGPATEPGRTCAGEAANTCVRAGKTACERERTGETVIPTTTVEHGEIPEDGFPPPASPPPSTTIGCFLICLLLERSLRS